MGLLCDLFVTTREEALAYEATVTRSSGVRMEQYSPVEFKGLTGLEFGTLWAILAREEWDVDKHMLIDVAFGDGNETWLHQFQEEYVDLLSRLDEGAIDLASQAWSKTDELSCSANDIRPVVEALAKLSGEAISTEKGLYMWGSL